jgi:two-component system response regulator HydG
MVKLLETVAQVSPSEATVLITGDSGTGKEMIAGAIHYNSPRKDDPFIKINCAAITETLLESELFGHEKGSFTGAQRRKEGKFRLAHGGSIFLDEIGEMPMSMQVKLLRVLQEREITRVGGEEVIKVDVRVIAASNRDLLRDIEQNRFREDLYYRLNVVELKMPLLKDRKEDIPLLAQHYLEMFSEKNRKQAKGFTPRAMDALLKYEWPGNVRELMNVIERCVVLSTADYIDQKDLPFFNKDNEELLMPDSSSIIAGDFPLEEVEKATILNTLESANGNKSEAARRLGITRKTLHKKLKKYGAMP